MSRRLRRLWVMSGEVYQQTGNPFKALWFAIRYVIVKLPLLVRQPAGAVQRAAITEKVRRARKGDHAGIPLLAVKITGGLGDALVIARFMRDLVQQCGPLRFDVFALHPQQTNWVFSAVEGLNACHDEVAFDFVMDEYDAALRINQFAVVQDNLLVWPDMMEHPRLMRAIANMIRFRPKIDVFVDRYPYMDNFLAQKAIYANRTRADFLHSMAGLTYGGDELKPLADDTAPVRLGLETGNYVTINNGFDQDFIISGDRATKCYPHFDEVIRLLRARWPQLQFVQIGSRRSDLLGEAAVNLVGRTSLAEVSGVLRGAILHIDNEGGLVHLARNLGIVSAVVFGPTPSAYFGYASNINIDPTFCGGCWWIKESWMDHCPRGFAVARCMTEQSPHAVAERISEYLAVHVGRRPGALPLDPAKDKSLEPTC